MADVLSQSQIDALIAAAASGEVDTSTEKKEEYSKYDFRSPRKYTKERLKMLSSVFENYTKVLNTRLNGMLHATCEVEVDTIDEQRYFEFSNALTDGQVVSLAYLTLNGVREDTPVIFCVTPNVMVSMFDRLLGGTGDVDEDMPPDYAYTALDLTLYQYLVKDFISIMGGSWDNYISLSFRFGRVETDPTLVQLVGVEETVVLVSINMRFSNCEGRIDICLPDAVLTRIFSEVSKQTMASRRRLEDHSDVIYSHLKDSELVITGEMARARVTLRDIYNLHVGDIIDLNMNKETPVSLRIGGRKWFTGPMGAHERYKAVKIQAVNQKPTPEALLEDGQAEAALPEGQSGESGGTMDLAPEDTMTEGGSEQGDEQ